LEGGGPWYKPLYLTLQMQDAYVIVTCESEGGLCEDYNAVYAEYETT